MLKNHQKYIEDKLKTDMDRDELRATLAHHREMTHNFQHERLIHLLVTLFFVAATLLIIGMYAAAIVTSYDVTLSICLALLTTIMVVTDFFYVRHYYHLENGVAKLYELEKQLVELSLLSR